LDLRRLAGVFAKRNHSADAFAAARGYVVAAGTVARFTGPFFCFVARVKKKNLPHHGLGKFFKGGRVASLANFIANVGGRGGLWCFRFRRPDDSKENQQQ
jgi:hypothetical protein